MGLCESKVRNSVTISSICVVQTVGMSTVKLVMELRTNYKDNEKCTSEQCLLHLTRTPMEVPGFWGGVQQVQLWNDHHQQNLPIVSTRCSSAGLQAKVPDWLQDPLQLSNTCGALCAM